MPSSQAPPRSPSDESVLDFTRSFVRFRIDLTQIQPRTISQPPPFTLNNARLSLECLCRVQQGEGASTQTHEFVLSSACKAEQVNVQENIWHDPAADMCLVASTTEFLVLKSWDRNNRGVMLSPPTLGEQPERQAGKATDAFSELRIDLIRTKCHPLKTTEEIVAAVLENKPLVSQTEFTTAEGTRVFLEYPVKVINASEREMFYQTDTGPVLVPDAAVFDGVHAISVLRQAYLAHNSLGCTEFLVNVPTPVGQGISVNHYSRTVKVTAKNQILALE